MGVNGLHTTHCFKGAVMDKPHRRNCHACLDVVVWATTRVCNGVMGGSSSPITSLARQSVVVWVTIYDFKSVATDGLSPVAFLDRCPAVVVRSITHWFKSAVMDGSYRRDSHTHPNVVVWASLFVALACLNAVLWATIQVFKSAVTHGSCPISSLVRPGVVVWAISLGITGAATDGSSTSTMSAATHHEDARSVLCRPLEQVNAKCEQGCHQKRTAERKVNWWWHFFDFLMDIYSLRTCLLLADIEYSVNL